jgi:hypothetical protein
MRGSTVFNIALEELGCIEDLIIEEPAGHMAFAIHRRLRRHHNADFNGGGDMKAQILAGIAAMALALRTPAGFAQTPMNPVAQVDRAGATGPTGSIRPYDEGSTAALNGVHTGVPSNPSYMWDQQEPPQGPGCRVGTGTALASRIG